VSTEIIVALIGGGGSTLLIKAIAGGVWKWLTGRQRAERDAIQALEGERRFRVQVEEQLYFTRAQLIQLGRSDLVPPFPVRGQASTWRPQPGGALHPRVEAKEDEE